MVCRRNECSGRIRRGITLNKRKLIKRIFFITTLLVFLIIPIFRSRADVIDDSESFHEITNSDKDVVLTVKMKRGVITIIGRSTAASSSSIIRWRTIGVNISKNPIPTTDSYYSSLHKRTFTGFGPVSDAGTYKYLPFDMGKKKSNQIGNIIETTITFDAKEVADALGTDFEDITEDTPIYLHAVFQTYGYDPERQRETGIRTNNIRDWKKIVSAETWGKADTLNDFGKYYNMKLLFKAEEQKNTLLFLKEDGSELAKSVTLESLKPGKTLSWSTDKTIIKSGGKDYELYKRVIKSKKSNKAISGGTQELGGSVTAETLRKGSTAVKLGGMDICLYYRPIKTNASIKLFGVDQDTGTVIKDEIDKAGVYAGGTYVQPDSKLFSSITYGGKTYKRTTKYAFTYIKANGSEASATDTLKTSSTPLSIEIPSDIKAGTTMEVEIYYQQVTDGDILVTVNAVNKLTGATIKTLTTGTVKGGEKYNYTISESKITSGSKTCDYSGTWKWSYISSGSTVAKDGTGEKVSFTAPSAGKITGGITVSVYYTEGDAVGSGDITLRVIMVTESGSLIYEISKEKVIPNQAVTKTALDPRSAGGMSYSYVNKWDYDYTTSSGKSSKSGTGQYISFTIPSTTLTGTTVTLRLYYKAMAAEVEVPEPEAPISLPLDSPSPYAVINGDKYGSPYFTSEKGISTTESQYVFLKTKDYLLGYTLVNRTGKRTYTIPVTMTYTLQYFTATPPEYGGPKPIADTVTDTQYIPVERAYSYWEITDLQYYNVSTAKVYNYSLPNGGVSLNANHAYTSIPALNTWHSSNVGDHVMPPPEAAGISVSAPSPITSSGSTRPTVEYMDLTSYALTMTGEARVKSDYIQFDGGVVLSNSTGSKLGASPNVSDFAHCTTIIGDKALYTDKQVIEAKKINGVYSSTANVSYEIHYASVGYGQQNKNFQAEVNDVIIHTPVICVPVVNADNDKWTQLLNPEPETVQIVLDPDTTLNDFTVRISNTLLHSNRPGYLSRDFSRSFIDSEHISYLARKDGVVRNEVCFPFDIYIDTHQDKNKENDQYITAGTWFVLGRDTFRFYVPMWIKEGVYTAQFRSIAVNGEDRLGKIETERNTSRDNYVATATVNFEISGRIYGMKLYDISDYPRWENVFRPGETLKIKLFEGAVDGTMHPGFNKSYSYYYRVGTKDQYGVETGTLSKYTFPLVNGSHPKYMNLGVLKTGYAVRFLLDTTGEMYGGASSVKIIPSFYYVDADGKNRRLVDLYYSEEINGKKHSLVKVGSGADLVNIKNGTTGNLYSRIPEKELDNTAKVQNMNLTKLSRQSSAMYSYSTFRLLKAFRTFIGIDYASSITSLPSYAGVKQVTGLDKTQLSKYTQRWYGTYKIPADVHVVDSGYDVYGHLKKNGIDYRESFWLKGGYIIVNFNIITINKDGEERLSYANGDNYMNNGNCSMLITEGAIIQKTDNNDVKFNFKAGDFVIYYNDKSYSGDYDGQLY